MLFSSISFIYYFLPIVLILYFIVPKKMKNLILLMASLIFYFFGEPIYCILLVFSSLSGYLHGIWIHKLKNTTYKKIPLISSIVIGIGLLMVFKYTNFFIININYIFHSELALLRIVLPIGISFYTFQILSYTIDVYRNEVEVQKNFLNFATYVSLFPQLIAGPIVRYQTIEKELTDRKHSFENFAYGINRFIIGLSKKVLIANTIGEIGEIFASMNEKTVVIYWMMAIGFMLQIYFDFSGYSDMAIGLGRIFGFHFQENFNYPYISKTITEFWRRWHISLGTWFRKYVYIPLGGNRVSYIQWIRNILVVWFLTGFWHGAKWNFIIWGLMFAILLMLEKWILKHLFKRLPSIFSHLYVILIVMLSFVIFNSNSLYESIKNIMGMFGLLKIPFMNQETFYYFRSYLFVLIIAVIGTTPLLKYTIKTIKKYKIGEILTNIVEPFIYIILLLIITGYLIDSSFNPFLYFRF